MSNREFQFIFTARDYQTTVAFYRDGLGLEVAEIWDRGPNDRGTRFQAASGTVVVMATPVLIGYTMGKAHLPQGVSMGIEVDDLDAWYLRARKRELPISQELTTFSWGERGFSVTDPNGIEVYLFKVLK
jgi:uncharacterized glyoxalase superfamily protein PhnB